MTTLATQPTFNSYDEYLASKQGDPNQAFTITSFTTAYTNNAKHIREMGIAIRQSVIGKCCWGHDINKDNAKKYGYKLGNAGTQKEPDPTIYFDTPYLYIVDASTQMVEYTNKEPLELGNLVLERYQRFGTVLNKDGSKGKDYEGYQALQEQHPGAFTQRQFFAVFFADKDGNRLHKIPVVLSMKGASLNRWTKALEQCQYNIGAIEGTMRASIQALSPYCLQVVCEEDEASNKDGTATAQITGFSTIGANVTKDTAAELCDFNAVGELEQWREANADFTAYYDAEVSKQIGTKIKTFLMPDLSAGSEPLVLPGTVDVTPKPVAELTEVA